MVVHRAGRAQVLVAVGHRAGLAQVLEAVDPMLVLALESADNNPVSGIDPVSADNPARAIAPVPGHFPQAVIDLARAESRIAERWPGGQRRSGWVIVFPALVTDRGQCRSDVKVCKIKCSSHEAIGKETAVSDKMGGKVTVAIARTADKETATRGNKIAKTIRTNGAKTGRTITTTTMAIMAIGITAVGTATLAPGGTTCGAIILSPWVWVSLAGA